MKAFSAFYDHLLPELRGCTTALVDLHLRQVARDFCGRTSAWRDAFPAISSEPDALSYYLVTSEADTDLVRVLRLSVNGCLLWCAFPQREDQEQPRFPADAPPFWIDADMQRITLEEQPSGDIVIEGSMRPAMTATSLPDLLLDDHLEAIRAGVLCRLMSMGGKPWTDRELAVVYRDTYTKQTNAAATKARGGNTRHVLRTRKWG